MNTTLDDVLLRLGRLIGAIRFLERPDVRRAAERAVADRLAPMAATIERVAHDIEATLVRTLREVAPGINARAAGAIRSMPQNARKIPVGRSDRPRR